MPQIFIEQPGVPGRTISLTSVETSLGRAEDNEIILVADEVSRHHATIRLDGELSLIRDLKSLNGTYVNRQRIVERVLSDNDEVWLGSKCRITFKDDPEPIRNQRKAAKTDSELALGLQAIQQEMDAVSASMTMIGQSGGGVPGLAASDGSRVEQDELLKMSRAFRRLDALYKASTLIASDFDLQHRMSQLLDLAIEVVGADRGFLMLKDEDNDTLGATVAREMGQELEAGSPSMGVARRAAIDGEPVLMGDSRADQQFGNRDSVIRQQILSAMCVPLRIETRILGALYVDSRQFDFQFTKEDLELLQSFANQSAMAIENVRLYEKMLEAEKRRANLGRFLPASIVELIMNTDEDVALGGQTKTVTTLFCDIRSFTLIAEQTPPNVLVGLLNDHFTAMTRIIFDHGGTLDKYVGDELMALFGAPFSAEDDALRAIRAAVAMQAANQELNRRRKEQRFPVLELGIGINTGEVIAGYIGSPERMDFTVLGDHVNIASRLCSVAEGHQILIGESTYDLVKDHVNVHSLGARTLKGKVNSIRAFKVEGLTQSVPA